MHRSITAPARTQAGPAFSDLLRHWRSVRRLSQLALAGEADISARHVSFLETGRSLPSRQMVQQLAHALHIPLAEQNALLLAAGYAPIYGARPLQAPELAPVRHALDFMLAQQEPFPALVLDDGWNVLMRNGASRRLFATFRAGYLMPDELADNAVHVLCHPGGLRQFMLGWEDYVAPFLQALHRDATHGLRPAAARLLDQVRAYPGVPERIDVPAPAAPLLTMRLRRGETQLAFFTTLTTFAMPQDVTLQQTRIESFFPADAATEAAARHAAR